MMGTYSRDHEVSCQDDDKDIDRYQDSSDPDRLRRRFPCLRQPYSGGHHDTEESTEQGPNDTDKSTKDWDGTRDVSLIRP